MAKTSTSKTVVSKKDTQKETERTKNRPQCGIIMPISAMEGCSSEHWKDVQKVIIEAVNKAGYDASLVSDSDDSGVIQKRIVQNLYNNDMVVCDVSCKNANVMFELGMRLAFDKPTIIIMDDKTPFSFDTAPIEHLCYPRDLNYYKIVNFKEELKEKILGTAKAAKRSDYTTFLKNFGNFKPSKIEDQNVTDLNSLLLMRLDEINYRLMQQPRRIMRGVGSTELQAKELIADMIRRFCDKDGIPESMLRTTEPDSYLRKQLEEFVEQNAEVRELCGSRLRLQRYINDYLEC